MKTIKCLSFFIFTVFIISCSDDDKKEAQQTCNCYYTLVEGGQPQEGWVEESDTIKCELNGIHIYYDSYMNGQPNDTFYRVLHCE